MHDYYERMKINTLHDSILLNKKSKLCFDSNESLTFIIIYTKQIINLEFIFLNNYSIHELIINI